MTTVVGVVLVAGLVTFMTGAAAWRIEYDRPHAESLPIVHADRRRRAWIHVWMIVAMFLTPAGLAALTALLTDPAAVTIATVAAVAYAIGAVCWIASLTFRLSVHVWAAERTVDDGVTPEVFAPLDQWASHLYLVHMTSAYLASATLAGALLVEGGWPAWLTWGGLVWGVLWAVGLFSRGAFAFYPPFWAHVLTGAVGILLLTR